MLDTKKKDTSHDPVSVEMQSQNSYIEPQEEENEDEFGTKDEEDEDDYGSWESEEKEPEGMSYEKMAIYIVAGALIMVLLGYLITQGCRKSIHNDDITEVERKETGFDEKSHK
jgi:hypothetical protein